jgi:hypothetical protein
LLRLDYEKALKMDGRHATLVQLPDAAHFQGQYSSEGDNLFVLGY